MSERDTARRDVNRSLIQEDTGEELALVTVEFIRTTPGRE
jgi:hypothetical protein